MLAAFVLLTITSSPIAAEVDAAFTACENASANAMGVTDPPTIAALREECRVPCVALAQAIVDTGIADPAPYVGRVLSAWRVHDGAIASGGALEGLAFDQPALIAALADLRALRFEVAHQVAFEALP